MKKSTFNSTLNVPKYFGKRVINSCRYSVVIVCAAMSLSANAASNDYSEMQQQLNIMNNIIKSSTAEKREKKSFRVTAVDSIYLHGQGVVFTLSTSSSLGRWGRFDHNFPMPVISPTAPIAPVSRMPPVSMDGSFNQEINIAVNEAMASVDFEQVIEQLQEHQEEFGELRNEQRELAYDVRNIEREKRDLQYQLRHADKDSQKELIAQKKALELRKVASDKKRKALEAQINKIKANNKKQYQEREKQRLDYFKNLTKSLAQTMCMYGNGLKALPKNERISFILKNGGDKVKRQHNDLIFVFNKRDVNACLSDEINVDKLLTKAKLYQF
jgi:hypothetical protein